MITVAAVQMEIAPLDARRNLAKIEKLVGELCNQQPVDLVVLPEDVLTPNEAIIIIVQPKTPTILINALNLFLLASR